MSEFEAPKNVKDYEAWLLKRARATPAFFWDEVQAHIVQKNLRYAQAANPTRESRDELLGNSE
jgi:hypothetical protein